MSKKTCRDCLHCSIDGADEVYCYGMPWHYPFGGSDTVTLDKEACKHFLERDKPTVFHRITASPEVLAEKLVYQRNCKIIHQNDKSTMEYWTYSWKSSVITGQSFETKAEAIAATVAKLKEVEK